MRFSVIFEIICKQDERYWEEEIAGADPENELGGGQIRVSGGR